MCRICGSTEIYDSVGKRKTKMPKKTLIELLNDKSVVTGREVVQRIKDKEKLLNQFEDEVEFELRNGRGRR